MPHHRILFRVDADEAIGLGHLSRCLTMARLAKESGAEASFALGLASPAARRLVASTGLEVIGSRFDTLEAAARQVDLVVFDIAHAQVLKEPSRAAREIAAARDAAATVAVIDGYRDQGLRSRVPQGMMDFVVAPYTGESAEPGNSYRLLAGPQYSILASEYSNPRPRHIRDEAKRILITCGGSDPKRATAFLIHALGGIAERPLEIRIVIGIGFSEPMIAEIKAAAAETCHSVSLVMRPRGLKRHMLWCDIALAMSGLTKYELAATGTPSILLSLDQPHHEAHAPFAAERTAVDLGLLEDASAATVSQSVVGLLDSRAERQVMSARGQRLVDGLGAARVLRELGIINYDAS